MESVTPSVPVVDISGLLDGSELNTVATQIDLACRRYGFFTITGHGVEPDLREQLESVARQFFALPDAQKAQIAMAKGGRAWRGWFGVGHELTSGRPDHKEGIYFGTDLGSRDPIVLAGRLLHGPNQWPAYPAELRDVVTEWMAAMANLAAQLLSAMAVGLGLDAGYFARNLTGEAIELFRMFHYPAIFADPSDEPASWGVGEHTDYGLLTILAQDDSGGLQVRMNASEGNDADVADETYEWVDVPADSDTLVCNIGDMLDLLTGGRYRSTPHRVIASTHKDRVSFPYFYDPGWDSRVEPLPLGSGIEHVSGLVAHDGVPTTACISDSQRWDGADVSQFRGTYGEYLSAKVLKVFPDLINDTR